MNYFAHVLLSKNNIDYQIGNLLTDTLKGRDWVGCSDIHREGMAMHKVVDKFTDNSNVVQKSIKRLGTGYLRGVIIDITFDHFLSKHWDFFVRVEKQYFIDEFYEKASHQVDSLPPKGERFIRKVLDHDILNAYNSFEDLAIVLTKLNKRLSEQLLKKENSTHYLPRLAAKYEILEEDFLEFFPTLIEHFIANSKANAESHYFRL